MWITIVRIFFQDEMEQLIQLLSVLTSYGSVCSNGRSRLPCTVSEVRWTFILKSFYDYFFG